LTFAEVLTENGVHTEIAASHFYFEPKFGIQQGFARVDNSEARTLPESNKDTASPRIYARLERRLAELKDLSDKGTPFFLFVHLFEPHSTYVRHPAPDFFGTKWMELYDGEIHFADRYVGKILERLAELGLDSSTAVVLFADHGEGNGEHGFKWHGQHIYNEVMHVPLLVRVPGQTARRVAQPVALVDLGPTVLGLFGIPPAASFEGRSLLPAVLGETLAPAPVYGQLLPYPYCKEEVHFLISGQHKLLYHRTNNTWSLFDLAADPREQRDLSGTDKARLEQMRGQLLGWLESGG
jgi:arylsulfatase A-like enzyme